MTETMIQWETMDTAHMNMAVEAHAKAMKIPKETVRRIFALANVVIIFAEDYSSCRVAAESIDVVNLLFKQYGKS